MKRLVKYFSLLFLFFAMITTTIPSHAATPSEKEVLSAMQEASDFMVNTVSKHGGYLWYYSTDLSEVWGEVPARTSQFWVQYITPYMGMMFLDAYELTGDAQYLRYAEKTANALIYGQHPLGGWHYLVDFDMTGIKQWYRDVASRFRTGYEEFRYYYGNCTFDDDTTQGATRFLLRLYMTTLDPAYREPLLKALDFYLISQYPNGAWPQRYPLMYEYVHCGLPDYTSYYTLNDRIMSNILIRGRQYGLVKSSRCYISSPDDSSSNSKYPQRKLDQPVCIIKIRNTAFRLY